MRNKNNPLSATHTDLPKFKRSNFNRGNAVRYSLPLGLFTPIEHYDISANSRVKLKLHTKLDSFPAVSPLYGSVKLRYDVFFAPYRIFVPELFNNNVTQVGEIDAIKFPVLRYVDVSDPTKLAYGTYRYINGYENENIDTTVIPYEIGLNGTSPLFGNVIPNGSLLEYLNYPTKYAVYGTPYARFDGSTSNPYLTVAYNYDVNNPDTIIPNSSSFGTFTQNSITTFNAIPFLAYIDAYCHYVANPQEDDIPYNVYGPGNNSFEDNYSDPYDFYKYPISDSLKLSKLQNLIPTLRKTNGFTEPTANITWSNNRAIIDVTKDLIGSWNPFSINIRGDEDLNIDDEESWNSRNFYNLLKNYGTKIAHVGLLPCTYLPDYFNSGIDVERYNNSNVSVSGTTVSINTYRLKEREWDYKVRNLFSSYRYSDWNYLQYGANKKMDDYTIAVGGDTITFNFQDILSQTNVNGANITDFVGGTAGKAQFDTQYFDKDSQFKTINFTAEEDGILLICARLVPEVDYYKGIPKFLMKTQMSDLYKPINDAVGFDDIFSQELDASIAFTRFNQSIWKVPYGWEYMKSYNKIHGLFRTPAFDSWTFNRKDTISVNIGGDFSGTLTAANIYNPTTYIDGTQYEDTFATISNEGDNFGIQTLVDLEVYQPMSKSIFNFHN